MGGEERRGRGIRGGEQRRRFFGNICGERKKEILQWKGRWCVGEGKGMEVAVVVCWSSDFFYGGSRVRTVGSGERAKEEERHVVNRRQI